MREYDADDFKKWLDGKFTEWSVKQPRPMRTLTRFAKWMGIPRESLNNYLGRGTKPSGDNLIAMARALGFDIYDVLGEVRPDEGLFFIITHWSGLNEKKQRSVVSSIKSIVDAESGSGG